MYDRAEYSIIFHEGNYLNVSKFEYSYSYGASEKLDGIDTGKNYDYEELKRVWNYPNSREFIIMVVNSTSANSYMDNEVFYRLGPEEPDNYLSVYSEDFDSYVLDEYGERTPVTVNIRVW